MNEPIPLAGTVRVFAGDLYNHDYLWFSSFEISKVSTTIPVLHNYALTYALSQYERGVSFGSSPRYDDDLAAMPLYVTPAESSRAEYTRLTYNALDDVTNRTDIGPSVNTPNLGRRVYLNPIYERQDNNVNAYRFYAFCFTDMPPRSVIRLGKKGCPVRIHWSEILNPITEFSGQPINPSHIINPLDVTGQLQHFEPIALPPHLLVRNAAIINDWFIRSEGNYIHVPKRVLGRIIGSTS